MNWVKKLLHFAVTFRVKKLLHFALRSCYILRQKLLHFRLLHFASKAVTFWVVTFCSVTSSSKSFSPCFLDQLSVKQSFSFYNIQLVVKKSLRTSWTSSFLTGNSEKSAILHSSATLHNGKSVILPRGKVPLHPGLDSALAAA